MRLLKFESAGPVSEAFRDSFAEVSLLLGPYGSGKSVTGIHAIMKNIADTKPDSDGVVRWRGVVIRNTYQMLTTNTVELFNEHVPKEFGKIKLGSPIRKTINIPGLEATIDFLAMDKDADKRRVEGGNYNFAWLDEARELPWSVVQTLMTRVRVKNDMGESQPLRIIFTSNPSSERHWMFQKFVGSDAVPGWKLFKQPGGRDVDENGKPIAENLKYLKDGYYDSMVAANDPSFVKVHVDNCWGQEIIGAAVVPEFNEDVHVAKEPLQYAPGLPLVIGIDGGPTLNPAALIGQVWPVEVKGKIVGKQLVILHEWFGENIGAQRAARDLRAEVEFKYGNLEVGNVTIDPAALQKEMGHESIYTDLWKAETQWDIKICKTNVLSLRVEMLRSVFQRSVANFQPAILVCPTCKYTVASLAGEYHWKQKSSPNGLTVSETEIDKLNRPYADIGDALGYLVIGTGEYDILKGIASKGRNQGRSSRIVIADGVGYGSTHRDLYGDRDDDIFR